MRLCFIDYRREMALIALREKETARELVAVGRLIKEPGTADGEFALLVTDAVQGHGLGTELLRRLIEVGRAEGLARIVGYVLAENAQMLEVARALGFETERGAIADPMVTVSLDLKPSA